MALPNDELLAKAVFDTTAFGGAGEAPLAVEQVTQFIELLTADQAMLPDVRTVSSSAPKWQESVIDFSGRIAKPGTEGSRLASNDRTAPTTDLVEMNTVLIRAEVPITDEVMEDNVAGPGLQNTLERMVADRFGYDLEELFINGDTGSADAYLAQLDGWLKQAVDNGHAVDATSLGQDYQTIFRQLINSLPDRHKRRLETDGRFYVPKRVETLYRDALANRETGLGDMSLTGNGELRYQGIKIVGVPNIAIAANVSHIMLAHAPNLYAGYQRKMKFESFRDPREGATSLLITARVDAKIAVPDAVAIAHDVDVAV